MSIEIDWNNTREIEILEATYEQAEKFGFRYGSDFIVLTQEHIQALLNGKMLAFSDNEYSTFLILK